MSPEPGPITQDTPIKFGAPPPADVDLVVIGAGVIGVFTALLANRAGLTVALLEKGRVAAEQSSRNWGWLRQQGRDRAELGIMMESIRLWEQIDQQTGGRVGFVNGGTTYLASSRTKLGELEQWLAIANEHNLDTHLLTQAQIARIVNAGSQPYAHWIGAIHTPSDGRAEPWQAVPAVAELAASEGVHIVEDCAVRMLRIQGGAVNAVVTERGTVRCAQAVLAAGAWSSIFLRLHGVSIPQLTVRQTVARTAVMPEVLQGNGADEQVAFRRRNDGGYSLAVGDFNEHFVGPDSFRHFKTYLPLLPATIKTTPVRRISPRGYPDGWSTARQWTDDEQSPFERTRVLNPAPNLHTVARIGERFAARFPMLGSPRIVNAWAGMIDTMPDIVPVIDRVESVSGLLVATGMSGHGMGIGPGVASVLTRLLTGRHPGFDLSRFRLSRFSDGSELVPGPHI